MVPRSKNLQYRYVVDINRFTGLRVFGSAPAATFQAPRYRRESGGTRNVRAIVDDQLAVVLTANGP
jgi:hypothetical protein